MRQMVPKSIHDMPARTLAGSARRVAVAVAGVVAVAAVACGGDGGAAAPPDATPIPVATSTPAPTVPPPATPTPRPPLTEDDKIAVAFMHRFYDMFKGPDLDVIKEIGEFGHPGLVAPLVEIAGFIFEDFIGEEIGAALEKLTGADLGGGFESQSSWYKWLDRNDGFEPVQGYAGWKGQFYADIAGGLDDFLYEGVPARIPLWAVQFGGVGKGGIPSVDDPVFIPAKEATYLEPDERVFGVFVNGEARAYPERIMRVHELSNDVVGGKPVVLVY